jgi:hypothetical protein
MKFLDAIRISIEFADFGYTQLASALKKVRVTHAHKSEFSIQALYYAWGIIDSVHRLRCLVNQMPNYKDRAPSKQIFLRTTTSVEALRNSIQHVATEIHGLAHAQQPVFGILSWCEVIDRDQKLIATGHMTPGQYANVATTTELIIPTDLADEITVTLSTAMATIDLTKTIRAVATLAERLETTTAAFSPNTQTTIPDLLMITHMQLEDDDGVTEPPESNDG